MFVVSVLVLVQSAFFSTVSVYGDSSWDKQKKIHPTDKAVVKEYHAFVSKIVATITVGKGPAGIGVDPVAQKVYVVNSLGGSNSVSVINASDDNVTNTIGVGLEPLGIALNPNTKMIYVADFGESKISVINSTNNHLVANVTVGFQPGKIAINTKTNMIYAIQQGVNDHTISVINGTTNQLVKSIDFGSVDTTGIAVNENKNLVFVTYRINPGGNTTWLGEVSAIDGKTNTIIKTIKVGLGPTDIAINPKTNMIYVSDIVENDVYVINGAKYQIINKIPVGDYPYGLGINTRTNTIFVADLNGNTVSVIDGANKVVSTIGGFNAPSFIGVNSKANLIYVNNYYGNTIEKIKLP